tara:strand:- start:6480 stop:6887 length:408 start_codon:yes stop_codon:yes gene_type:complete
MKAQQNTLTKNFDYYPGLEELLRRSNESEDSGKAGMPGFTYAIFGANEAHMAQNDGWERITNMPVFTINEVPCELMTRGERLPGCDIGDIKCSLNYSSTLEDLTNIKLGTQSNKTNNSADVEESANKHEPEQLGV